MELELGETRQLLRAAVRKFLEAECSFERVRECEREGRADLKLWRALCAQGYLATPFPSELGGGDGGIKDAGLLVEEVARRAALLPIVEVLASALTLHHHGAGDDATTLLQQTLSGEALPVPALLEAQDDFDRIELRAPAADGLRGEKFFVDYATAASHHLVTARDSDGELALYVVATDDAALKCEALPNLGRTPQSRVRYDGARARRISGPDGVAFLVQVARALTCAQLLACMDASLSRTVAYTNVRKQFGRPLSTFQAVQHHAADMAMHIESSRFLTYETLDALDRGVASEEQVALTKASLSRALPDVVMTGHQLHGGQGYIEENDLYFFTIRGKDRCLAWGSAEECLGIVARGVEQKARWL